jgi:DNA-binding NarL/FixJ family response regulator
VKKWVNYCSEIHTAFPDLKILLAVTYDEFNLCKNALTGLVSGFISKDAKGKVIRWALDDVVKGFFYYDKILVSSREEEAVPEWLESMMRSISHTDNRESSRNDITDELARIMDETEKKRLTKLAVEYLLYKGYSNWEIADILDIDNDEVRLLRMKFILKLTETNSMVYAINKQGEKITLAGYDMKLLVLIASGYLNKEIVDILNLEEETIKSLRRDLIRKFGAKSSMTMVMYALSIGLIKLEDIQISLS